mgnify:CR=1 FL=1
MFGKSKEASYGTETKAKIGTIIGEGAVFDGNLSAPDSMRIDGTINGNCRCEKELIIGASGAVEGNISAQNLIISGKVHGDIFANGKLELLSTGKILGNIAAKSLVIDENASFDGRCTMATTATPNSSVSSENSGSASAQASSGKEDSDKNDSEDEKSISAEGPPSRNFVRIPTEPAGSEASTPADTQTQPEPAPVRPRSRSAKAAASQNSPQ